MLWTVLRNRKNFDSFLQTFRVLCVPLSVLPFFAPLFRTSEHNHSLLYSAPALGTHRCSPLVKN